MNKSPYSFCALMLCGLPFSEAAESAGFGGGEASLGFEMYDDSSQNIARVSVDSYVDEGPTSSTRWGSIGASITTGGDSFSDRFTELDLLAVSGWRAYGSGRMELIFMAGGVAWNRNWDLMDLEYGRAGLSVPIYGDWVRLALEADLRTRMNLGSTSTQSTSIGLPITMNITTPIDRPLIVTGDVGLRAGLQVVGDDSEPLSVDISTSVRVGYSVIQEPDMNVQIYLQHNMESLNLEGDDSFTAQLATLGVDFGL
jgi:hypothetical protein